MAARRSESSRRAGAGRRAFLQAGMAAVYGGSCLALGLARARAEAAATGRPVLTEASFNRMMREAQASGQIREMAADAGRDLQGWLLRSFTLTPVQVQRIQALPPALAPVARQGGSIQIALRENRSAATAKKAQRKKLQQEAEQAQQEAEDASKLADLVARAADGTARSASWTMPARRAGLAPPAVPK